VFAFDLRDPALIGVDPLRQPMFLHINLALGGNWGGEIDNRALPARFEIARIRIFRWAVLDAASAGKEALVWGR
jgi:hypothetical protein